MASLLLIDDDPGVRESLRRMLAREHDVQVASSADAGLLALEQGRFDLILCDLVMPGKSGVEFVEEAAQRWPELHGRLVLMTGAILASDQTSLFAELGVALLQKPIVARELEALIVALRPPAL